MHGAAFIQDMAVIMLTAGVVTVLFHALRQPVVLGYIAAGLIIGPHTPPFSLIHDENTIKTLAELGVIFLLFCLGLEFSLRKLARVGMTAVIAAVTEIILMMWAGYEIGRYFGWQPMDCLFLGAILSISSTTIIVKALDDLKLKRERFAQIIFGILIVEDILAIGMIALLSGIATSGGVSPGEVGATVGQLGLFMVVSLVLGILLVPRMLAFVARFQSDEMVLVAALGLCFGFCLLVSKLGYSVALGAFMMGAIIAESRQLAQVERLMEPLRDMFSAIFFVSVGLMIDPGVMWEYALPIAVISAAVIAGKVATCGAGALLAGHDGRTALRVGMGVSQIGEFSFIIAALGLSLGVTSHFLYPIAVAVSAITTLTTPYLIKAADPLAVRLERHMPRAVVHTAQLYGDWLRSIRPSGDQAEVAAMLRRMGLHVFVNMSLVIAVFIACAWFAPALEALLPAHAIAEPLRRTALWSLALLVSLPFLIAAWRKLKALSMLLAELGVSEERAGAYTRPVRRVVAELIPACFLLLASVLIAMLSSSILPPADWLAGVLVVAVALVALCWRWMVRLQARLQVALREGRQGVDDAQ